MLDRRLVGGGRGRRWTKQMENQRVNKQTNTRKQTNKQTSNQTNKQTHKHTHTQTNTHTRTQTNKTNKQTNTHTHTHTNKQTHTSCRVEAESAEARRALPVELKSKPQKTYPTRILGSEHFTKLNLCSSLNEKYIFGVTLLKKNKYKKTWKCNSCGK